MVNGTAMLTVGRRSRLQFGTGGFCIRRRIYICLDELILFAQRLKFVGSLMFVKLPGLFKSVNITITPFHLLLFVSVL